LASRDADRVLPAAFRGVPSGWYRQATPPPGQREQRLQVAHSDALAPPASWYTATLADTQDGTRRAVLPGWGWVDARAAPPTRAWPETVARCASSTPARFPAPGPAYQPSAKAETRWAYPVRGPAPKSPAAYAPRARPPYRGPAALAMPAPLARAPRRRWPGLPAPGVAP